MDNPTLTLRGDGGNHTVAGSAWGPFQLLQKVGQGGFGEVYRAFDTTLQRDVALKLLLPTSQLDETVNRQAVLAEARAMARVRHPNVVAVHGVDTHDGRVGFWSDFVNGKTLSQLLQIQGAMGASEAARIGIDVCRALGAVHSAGLLHRDIKTGNIMRETGGRILLMDFGLSLDRSGVQNISGTPVYMAPELLKGAPATIGSDLYAVGIVLFRLLTSKYPVDGISFEDLNNTHQSGKRLMLLDIRQDVPEDLARVVEKACHPDAAQRYSSTGQLITALSAITGASVVAPVSAKRRPWPIIAAAVAVLSAIPFAVPEVRNRILGSGGAIALNGGSRDDYMKARDLVEHYYRPRALETAIPLLEKTVAAKPNFAPAFADLGRANVLQFIQQRDEKYVEPARVASLKALELKPDLASPHVTLGTLYTYTNKYDLATQELDDALRLDQFNAAGYSALGELLNRQGRVKEAEQALEKARTLAPSDWRILSQVGQYYSQTGKLAKAAELCKMAVDIAPDNARAHNNLGLIYRNQDRLAEAAVECRKAIALEPTFGRYRNFGEVLFEQGDYKEAEANLDRATSLRPNHYRAWGDLAILYRVAGAPQAKVAATFGKAIDLATTQLKQSDNDAYLLADLALYQSAVGNRTASIPLLKKAALLASDKPDALVQIAAAYETMNDREQSLYWIDRAIASGFPRSALLRNPQLAGLRSEPRFQQTIQRKQ